MHGPSLQSSSTSLPCIFLPSSVKQGNAPHLVLRVSKVRYRTTEWWDQGHTLSLRMKLTPNPLSLWPATTLRAMPWKGAASGFPQGGKLFHMISVLLPSSHQPCDSCLHCFWLYFDISDVLELTIMPSLLKWLLCVSQCKTQYYKLLTKIACYPLIQHS